MPIPQTSVSVTPAIGTVGSTTRSGHKIVGTGIASGVVRCGQWVTFSGDLCSHPSAVPAFGTRQGLALKNEHSVDGNYADKDLVSVLEEGFAAVDPETAVTRDTQAYARIVVVTTEEKGAMRADAGGATGGVTITVNTATNTSVYTATLRGSLGLVKTFNFTSDADATPTEIATGLRIAIDADTEFVATNPTATSILVVGTTITFPVDVVGLDYRLSAVSNAAAFAIPAVFRTTASTGVAELEVIKK